VPSYAIYHHRNLDSSRLFFDQGPQQNIKMPSHDFISPRTNPNRHHLFSSSALLEPQRYWRDSCGCHARIVKPVLILKLDKGPGVSLKDGAAAIMFEFMKSDLLTATRKNENKIQVNEEQSCRF
jgi:hypothetical protein